MMVESIYFRVNMKSKLESKISTDVLFNQVLLNNGGGSYNTSTVPFTVPKLVSITSFLMG